MKNCVVLHHPVLLNLVSKNYKTSAFEIKLFHVCTCNISTMLLYNSEWNRQLPAAHCTQMTYCEMNQMYSTCMIINDRHRHKSFFKQFSSEQLCHSSHFSICSSNIWCHNTQCGNSIHSHFYNLQPTYNWTKTVTEWRKIHITWAL
jgi:hypothetical protein